MTLGPLLVFPDPPPPLLAQTLDLGGHVWKAVANASVAAQHEPPDGWSGALVVADEDAEGAFVICRALRKRDAGADRDEFDIRKARGTEWSGIDRQIRKRRTHAVDVRRRGA